MAHQVKARITKCGVGMEHAVPDAPQEAAGAQIGWQSRQAPIPQRSGSCAG